MKGYVTIRLLDRDRQQLEQLAEEAERTLSAEIRLAIREHLAKTDKLEAAA
jgi:predicted transcriptional regulator